MVKNVNRTARLQWKVDTIKNCKYLQCSLKKPMANLGFLSYEVGKGTTGICHPGLWGFSEVL